MAPAKIILLRRVASQDRWVSVDGLWLLSRPVVCLETFLGGRQRLAAARCSPFGNQRSHFGSECHQSQGRFRAVQIMPDLVVHGLLDAHHFGPQIDDFAADFINSVVHGFLEQRENVWSSYISKRGSRK